MTVFKDIEYAKKLFTNSLASNLDEKERELYMRKLTILNQIIRYTEEMQWLKQERARARVRTFIKQGCDYNKTKKELDMEKLNTLHVAINYASNALKESLGQDTLTNLIHTVDLDQVEHIGFMIEKLLKQRESQYIPYFTKEVHEFLPNPKRMAGVLPKDYTLELQLLNMLSTMQLADLFQRGLNAERISHILYILETDDIKYSKEKELFTKLLNGDFQSKKHEKYINPMLQVREALLHFNSVGGSQDES